jgi:hypothetical protein
MHFYFTRLTVETKTPVAIAVTITPQILAPNATGKIKAAGLKTRGFPFKM